MPLEKFRHKRFHAASEARIDQANAILEEYGGQGFKLTLRQLYYKFVARNLIPNNQKEYKKLGELINDARLAGLIDWDAIVDHTRSLRGLMTWEDPAEIVSAQAYNFRLDPWKNQKQRIEVWIEKDAAVSIVAPVCNAHRIDFFSCRGYTGQSAMYSAGKRLEAYHDLGKEVTVLHFGDHDPSGMDMSRDIEERLKEFARQPIQVLRCALNLDQVQQYNPPPNPAKETDSRCAGYVQEFGQESWELDALEPKVINDIIEREVLLRRDNKEFNRVMKLEKIQRDQLRKCSDNWSEVTDFLKTL